MGQRTRFNGMNLRFYIGVAWLVLCATLSRGQDTNLPTARLWFPVGEKLKYNLYWGIIPVGAAEILSEWRDHEGRKCIALSAVAKTSTIVSKIYPVNDFVESIVDPKTFLPILYTQKLREGSHKRDDKVLFDHKAGIAHWQKSDGSRKADVAITNDTRDVLSLYYSLREKGFDGGQVSKFGVFVDNKIYKLHVEGQGEKKIALDKYGRVDCLEVEPKAKFGEIFVRKGRVKLWFSKDQRHICTQMSGKVPLASVHAVLTEVQGPGDDSWVKPAEEKKDPGK